MHGQINNTLAFIAALLLALLAFGGCGDSEPAAPGPPVADQPAEGEAERPPPATGEAPAPGEAPSTDKPSGPAESGTGDPRVTELERRAAETVVDFVAALDDRDGTGACALLAPGALEPVELPERRPGCAGSLEASIGYRDPRGLPVWKGAEVVGEPAVELADGSAKVLITVRTTFADRELPSIEDDIVYLTRSRDGWIVSKPGATLYRAVGIADLPPSILAPPG